jgi:glutathione synthase/RimK-type ligase-like ATP-grasp enzyme
MTDPVLLMGIPSEPPLELVARALTRLQVPHLLFNQRSVGDAHAALRLVDGCLAGVLAVDGQAVPLEAFGGVYTREFDHRLLPEVEGADAERRAHADVLHEILSTFCELADARVVNRIVPGMSNASKPYQAQVIARRFRVPETLVTTDPDAVHDLRRRHERLVFKSISGARSIVRELTEADLERLPALAVCPVQFQQRIAGTDVRAHTLADGTVIATSIESTADDWRYAREEPARLRPWAPSDDLAEQCLLLAADLGLDFAGIDLRITSDGEVYCLEVNPSPAYSAFEEATGQPIAAALARYLAGG